jgi:hypothetical protein
MDLRSPPPPPPGSLPLRAIATAVAPSDVTARPVQVVVAPGVSTSAAAGGLSGFFHADERARKRAKEGRGQRLVLRRGGRHHCVVDIRGWFCIGVEQEARCCCALESPTSSGRKDRRGGRGAACAACQRFHLPSSAPLARQGGDDGRGHRGFCKTPRGSNSKQGG